jgi:hypothetical protein
MDDHKLRNAIVVNKKELKKVLTEQKAKEKDTELFPKYKLEKVEET